MPSIKIAGFDPSFRNFGFAKGNLDLETRELTELELSLVTTSSTKQKNVYKNSDDLERSRALFKGMEEFFADVDLICIEIPVGSQTARAAVSYGVCIGLIASITKPVIQLRADEIKILSGGGKNATKKQMIAWATQTHPEANWLTAKTKGVMRYIDANEHLADAVGAIHAGVLTDQFKLTVLLRK